MYHQKVYTYDDHDGWYEAKRRNQKGGPTVRIPASTSNLYIFPRRYGSYALNNYNPGHTGGRLSIEEVQKTLGEVDKHIAERNPDVCRSFCYMMTVLLALMGLLTYMLASFTSIKQNNSLLIGLAVGAVVLFIFLIAACRKATAVAEEVRHEVEAICEEHNKQIRPRGLAWEVPVFYEQWMELTISGGQGVQPTYVQQPGYVVQQPQYIAQPQYQYVQQPYTGPAQYVQQPAYNPYAQGGFSSPTQLSTGGQYPQLPGAPQNLQGLGPQNTQAPNPQFPVPQNTNIASPTLNKQPLLNQV